MKKLLFFTLFLYALIGLAQDLSKKIDLKQGDIAEKFDELYDKSGKYKQYKVVEHSLLLELKKQVLDSFIKERKQIEEARLKIMKLKNRIADLEKELSNNQQEISSLMEEKQNIVFLGMPVDKVKFKLLVAFVFLILLSALLYFIHAYRNNNIVTNEARRNLSRVEEEYYSFKTQALEREQLLKRQLLDEQKKHQ